MLRVAVLGCRVGEAHVQAFRNLADRYAVTAVCDLNEPLARMVADRHQVPRVVPNLEALCSMGDVDVIDICTPSHLHVAQVKQVLAAGKHVICEKPIAGSLAEVDDLIQVEAASGKRIMPIFQKRFGNGLQKLKLLQRAGLTGQPYVATAETHWRRRPQYYATWHGKWRSELGGALVTLGIHNHDIVSYVLGPAKSVFARLATLVNPIETEDCASITMQMANGALATMSVTTGSSVELSRHRFCFSNLLAESNTMAYANGSEPWTITGDTPELNERIQQALAGFTSLPERFEGQFYLYAIAMEQGTEFPVTLADARASIEMLTAIYYCAETGQPVTLPLGADHPKYTGWLPADDKAWWLREVWACHDG